MPLGERWLWRVSGEEDSIAVMSDQLVSIVIPVANGLPFLQETITSALEQRYPNVEVVVVDNASTDGTTEYLRSLSDPRLRVVYRQVSQPAAANWTEAISHAQGSMVKLMCADDLLAPDGLARQVALLESYPRSGLVANRRSIMNGAGEIIKHQHGLGGLRGEVDGREAIRSCLLAGTNLLGEPACVLFRADVIKAAMPWEGRWPYMTDMATYAKALFSTSVVCDPEPLATFRITATSWSSKLLKDQPKHFAGWRALITQDPDLHWSSVDQIRSNFNLVLRTAARRCYFLREERGARRH